MKTLTILLAVFAALFVLGGTALLLIPCARGKNEDLWDPEVIRRRGYDSILNRVQAGREWIEAHPGEELELFSYDGLRLRAHYVPHENARGTFVLMHGWRSHWKLDFSCAFRMYYDMGFNLMLPVQRAHGESEGLFITYGVKESRDAVSWATYAAQLLGDDRPVFLSGVSMGASTVLMSADLDHEPNVKGLIADCGFTSPYDIIGKVLLDYGKWLPARRLLGWMGIFARIFAGFGLRERSTTEAVKHTALPILFIHGKADNFVPWQMSQQAYDACVSEKEIHLVDDAGHGLSYVKEPERLTSALSAFVDRHASTTLK